MRKRTFGLVLALMVSTNGCGKKSPSEKASDSSSISTGVPLPGDNSSGDNSVPVVDEDQQWYEEDLADMADRGYTVSGCPASYEEYESIVYDQGDTVPNCA